MSNLTNFFPALRAFNASHNQFTGEQLSRERGLRWHGLEKCASQTMSSSLKSQHEPSGKKMYAVVSPPKSSGLSFISLVPA